MGIIIGIIGIIIAGIVWVNVVAPVWSSIKPARQYTKITFGQMVAFVAAAFVVIITIAT